MSLYSRANIEGEPRNRVLKVASLADVLRSSLDPEHCALWVDDSDALLKSRAIEDMPWGALIQLAPPWNASGTAGCTVRDLSDPSVLAPGDVVGINARRGVVSSLYRRGSRNNSLLVTERCNSYCVMCSQPPKDKDERGRIDDLVAVVRLIDRSEQVLGITGGEPTLLGDGLFRLFGEIKKALPDTRLHVLTNGRRFADRGFAAEAMAAAPAQTVWAIPLYTESPEIHDFVVQVDGAFAETMKGLWNLAGERAHVEMRIVLQRAVIPRIRQQAHFVSRNLSFVDHVAWMGLEPMGFARPNWKSIWVEPEEYVDALGDAVSLLDSFGIATSIFNLPLCVLPRALWPFAAKSISDWKNTYLPECQSCLAKTICGGFFASASRAHVPESIHPLTDIALVNPLVTSDA